MIVSFLSKKGGFFSQFFFLVNHYLLAKRFNLNFVIDSDGWLFKYNNGWVDYFNPLEINKYGVPEEIYMMHPDYENRFTISQYKEAIKEIYLYNTEIQKYILLVKQNLNIHNYDAIFIRHGDKLTSETIYMPISKYIDVLLEKSPNCHTLFVQTDDYNVITDTINEINNRKLKIKIVSLCKETCKGGMVIFDKNRSLINSALTENATNKKYISENINNLMDAKSIDSLNPDEMYEHVLDLLIGIDIVLHSNVVVCDYYSNISRFIKLAHVNSNQVFDVENPNVDIDWNKVVCPAYSF